jgi:hypothetical protein
MQQSQDDLEVRLTAASVARARAEHVEWAQMLTYADQLAAEQAHEDEFFRRQALLRSIPLEIAVATGHSEGQVHRILAAAERLRDQAPAVWSAFADGVIDARRAVLISDAVGRLQRPASVAKLNLKAVAYAADHTSVELKAWLKRFVARVESDLFNDRAENERAERRVVVDHTDDAMAWLSAYLPSHVAAAIDRRLTKEAHTMVDDPRTLAQRRADLFACWLTTNEDGDIAVNADIAVVLDATTLAGADDKPAVSSDGSFIVPAAWVLDSAAHPFWHTILTNSRGNTLEHRYHGRFAPDILKKALMFTHGVCQAPTCTTAAEHCDADHRIPYPHGPTTGSNIWPLCKRHHQMKSHDVITWTLHSGRQVDAEPVIHAA